MSAATDPVLDEHRLGAAPVLPGTGHLDIVVRAYRETFGSDSKPVRLGDVAFLRVLIAREPHAVRVEFQPDDEGWTFTVSSTPVSGQGTRTAHVTGTVRDAVVPSGDSGTLAALRARLSRSVPVLPPSRDDRRLFTIGPRWDTARRVSGDAATDDEVRRGTERLVDLALPEPFHADLARHPVHPALLDCATAEARVDGVDDTHLPFGYESLELYRDLPGEISSHIRRRPGVAGLIVADIDVYAADGSLVARIGGYTMRHVTGPDSVAETASTDSSAPREGIEPAAGARLLLTLLSGGRHPHQLAVRPYLDGKPIPLSAPPLQAMVTPPASAPAARPTAAPIASAGTGHSENEVRPRLAALWQSVLGVGAVAGRDDFFELGGNSLAAVELMSGIKDEFGVRLSLVTMFDHPTFDGLIGAISQAKR